ncbi:MAG: C2H2-type zinc finger protein [Haloarculaceae archaeon]
MSQTEAAEETEYDCKVCGRTFESPEAVEAHLRDMGLLY